LEEALSIRAEILGKKHRHTAYSLGNLAEAYSSKGDAARALPLHQEALAILKETFGEKHADTATSLNNLGAHYRNHGDFVEALPLYQQALAIRVEVFGELHPLTAASISNLAEIYTAQGDYAQAERLCNRALKIQEELFGDKHPDTALSINNLAYVHLNQNEYESAIVFGQRALSIYTELYGEKHPLTATSLNNLSAIYSRGGDYASAVPLAERALAIYQELLGPKHPDTLNSLINLAGIYYARGDGALALRLAKEAPSIYTEIYGDNHPGTAKCFNQLAMFYFAEGDHRHALSLFQQAATAAMKHAELSAAIQSERQQLAYASANRIYLDSYISCALVTEGATSDCYQHVLAWKGAVLLRQRQMRLARAAGDPNEQRLWQELQTVASTLATQSRMVPPSRTTHAWRQQLAELTDQKEQLEARLSRLNGEFRQLQTQTRLTPDLLSKSLPKDVALVDLLEYTRIIREPREPNAPWNRQESRMVAFLVRLNKPIITIDLGSSAPINSAVHEWRANFGGSGEGEEDSGQVLRSLVWEPLARHLEGETTIIVSPDGALGLIPWGALPGREPGTYLLEEVALASAAVPQLIPEVLEPRAAIASEPSLLVVGNVDYGASPSMPSLPSSSPAANHSDDQDRIAPKWAELPGTQGEVNVIATFFRSAFPSGEVKELMAGNATEVAFRSQAERHRFLHVATHGFFAPAKSHSGLAPLFDLLSGRFSDRNDLFGEQTIARFHPGLLSGLVLANANRPPAAGVDDGVLTAIEAGALNLHGVDIVTLSACDTGLGEAAGGEGLLGLQRAFQIAGARTTVASLWRVNDEATKVLMGEFYDNLWRKKLSRIESLRQAQLTMLRQYDPQANVLRGAGKTVQFDPAVLDSVSSSGKRTSPQYWAAFVLSGDWQ
jgi:CHAT domain-containing protein